MADPHTAIFSRAGDTQSAQATSTMETLGQGTLLVLAPHMDDETLGCGGTMALHSDPSRIHCLFATDGSRSPAPLLPWTGSPDADLAGRRRREAVAALGELGVAGRQLSFLDLPDGALSRYRTQLTRRLADHFLDVRPDIVLAPFRLDAHPDHMALNHATRIALRGLTSPPILLEYFVYFRLRLLPGNDIRRCIPERSMIRVDTAAASATKMRALMRYETQVRALHSWQERPILTAERLRERCETPEYFLCSDPFGGLLDVFPRHKARILAAFLAQRFGKRPKDQALAMLSWLSRFGKK